MSTFLCALPYLSPTGMARHRKGPPSQRSEHPRVGVGVRVRVRVRDRVRVRFRVRYRVRIKADLCDSGPLRWRTGTSPAGRRSVADLL